MCTADVTSGILVFVYTALIIRLIGRAQSSLLALIVTLLLLSSACFIAKASLEYYLIKNYSELKNEWRLDVVNAVL
jgi:hypothetical protein